jgi:FixJ family two-component response regulator
LSCPSLVAIVDDDAAVRMAMGSLVRASGHRACLFDSAEAFLASPCLDRTACLIVDVRMPGLGGLGLQAALQRRQPRIPVIFITASPEAHFRRQAEAAGAVGYFGKPVEADALLRCLEAALQGAPPAA